MNERTHTGRRRNEAAREAILRAAGELLAAGHGANIAVAAIADRAGVGKQTIYRWWPSKSAVLLDAMLLRAGEEVPDSDSGDLAIELRDFLRNTFAAAADNRTVLRGVLREALTDVDTMTQLATFTASRRAALQAILDRAHARGQLADGSQTSVLADQTFGLLWYRLIFEHAPLDEAGANELVDALLTQMGNPRPTR